MSLHFMIFDHFMQLVSQYAVFKVHLLPRPPGENFFFLKGGIHLLSRAVSSKVPSAAYVLTIVFGMGTGVSHKRIDTTCILLSAVTPFN